MSHRLRPRRRWPLWGALLLASTLPLLLLSTRQHLLDPTSIRAREAQPALLQTAAPVVLALAVPGLAAGGLVADLEHHPRAGLFLAMLANTAFWWAVLSGVAWLTVRARASTGSPGAPPAGTT